MISRHLFLARPLWSTELFLLKMDYEATIISKPHIGFSGVSIAIDQLNKSNFIIHNYEQFVIGHLVGDEIVFGPRRIFDYRPRCLKYLKLAGNIMSTVYFSDRQNDKGAFLWEYSEIDLITSTKKTTDVPATMKYLFHIGHFEVSFLFLYISLVLELLLAWKSIVHFWLQSF